MRIALIVIILFLEAIVSELKVMPNLVIIILLVWAGCALGSDYYKSISKSKGKKE